MLTGHISVEEMPGDLYAEEELMLGALSKCKKLGSKRKEKKIDEVVEVGQRWGLAGRLLLVPAAPDSPPSLGCRAVELDGFRLTLYQPGGVMGCLYRVEDVIDRRRSRFQDIMVVRLKGFGKALVLDGLIQSAEADEYIYHEALVHPAMLLHPSPRRVLILGGGEGATLREVLRHPTVEEAVMVDIDEEVVRVSRELLPEWHQGAFEDPRARVVIMDGFEYVKRAVAEGKKFDVVVMDLTDPYGSEVAKSLYTVDAFKLIKQALSGDGVLSVQAGSSTFFPEAFKTVRESVAAVFRYVVEYGAWVPSFAYVNSFLLASDAHDPRGVSAGEIDGRIRERGLRLRYLISGSRYVMLLELGSSSPRLKD